MCSGGTFPDDDGSRQQVKNSLFVGESDNYGMPLLDNRIWGRGGSDLTGRTLPRGMYVTIIAYFSSSGFTADKLNCHQPCLQLYQWDKICCFKSIWISEVGLTLH